MAKSVILDNEHITVWFDSEHRLVHHQMHKYTHGEPFREALLAGLDAFRAHGATKWLSDDRANNALPPDDEEWATTVWFPQVRDAGWKFWAIVLPEMVVGQMNIKRYVDMYAKQGITVRMFSDPVEALRWVSSC